MILWTFRNHDRDGEFAFCIPLTAHILHLHVNEAVVLIPLTEAVHVLLQLRLVQPP